ncbi:inner membrane protein YgaP [Streptomyces jeddahensis]|uniref:Inner membrane protein YgaP n=1 Tax=Streptomyces jeddahensis TaxID=1716141 RepID=A0A177HP55_9ACTN|nr:inner membrane protein YgaP [Streptomyces jeddahensis]
MVRPAGAREVWGMERQVRLVAGSLVLIGVLLGLVSPWFLILSGGIAAGLVFSAGTNTCGMAAIHGKLPTTARSPAPRPDTTLANFTS